MTIEEEIKPNVTLDVTGSTCPGPILGVRKMVAELDEGQVLLLFSDCPGTRDDLNAWAEHTGNTILRTRRMQGDVTGYYIRRGGAAAAEPEAALSLDMRGSVCPAPIIEARRMLMEQPAGTTLKLVSDCPGARSDVEGWARMTEIDLLQVRELGPHEWAFYLRRAG
ncbi:MAG: sulfurtransferase TusA family protein [Burkholderiaceae bacterium]|nr:sulfurtransferase TusA family protein [Burkholderiaceae bacterium]